MSNPILINGKIEAEWDGNTAQCSGCGASVGFAIVTKSGKRMPVDLDENNTSHFATCAKAREFRKQKTEKS